MPTPKSLQSFQASRTLANRLGRVADRLRQFSTSFGLRPYRIFLVWTTFDGEERGEGREREIRRVEILPTPRISELTAVQQMLYGAGTVGTGTIRVDLISVKFPESVLNGSQLPSGALENLVGGQQVPQGKQELETIQPNVDFWWELRFDGRTGDIPVPLRFRLSSSPVLLPGQVGWAVVLEKQEEPTSPADRLPPFADR